MSSLASGRGSHPVKVTVYMTHDELNGLDATVLEVRRRTGLRVDRGRYIREALASSSLAAIASRIKEAS